MSETSARDLVSDVLGPAMTREIWSGNYDKVLPLSVQNFDLTAVLPAVFYMFRRGYRRGPGNFLKTFGDEIGTSKERRSSATIERVAALLADNEAFVGFQGTTEQAILGDLLLAFCLENVNRKLGRGEQIQRAAPAHYMASWLDLPPSVGWLRYVPEMVVAMLADQSGEYVEQTPASDQSWFGVGRGFEQNLLLQAFHQGVAHREGSLLSDRTGDIFQETAEIGLDQLLMVRLAQQLGSAPDKLRGGEGERISNQRPLAEKAARSFSEDIRRFVRAYAANMPRHAFVEMLESCMAVGLTTILTNVVDLLLVWEKDGILPRRTEQQPASLFVDCSNGMDRGLRAVAEQSMDDFVRRLNRIPVLFMALRLLDYGARNDRKLKKLDIPQRPYANQWISLLGDLLYKRREEGAALLYNMEQKAGELAEKLEEDFPETAQILNNDEAEPNPVWRLAEALTHLQGRTNQKHLFDLLDSSLMMSQPNGLAAKRSVMRSEGTDSTRRRRDVRSLVFSDAVLDYLVHLHVLPNGNKNGHRWLSFQEFLRILQERYGLFVDSPPPGLTISNHHLQQNRRILERRLRELGLLVGVNDAEAMKHLRPRFVQREDEEEEIHGLE
jgi:hypothetical protein